MADLTKRIYLAGPEVFFPDAIAIGKAKKDICRQYGFEGCFPFDNEVDLKPTQACAFTISALNEGMITRSDLVIANLSPFRGISADPGTVFEVGYASGLGKKVHGYSCDPRSYYDRVRASDPKAGSERDKNEHQIENFGLADNLMIQGAIKSRDGIFLAEDGDNLELFERVIVLLAPFYQNR